MTDYAELLVVGGGPAGASAALVAARQRIRRVVVIDRARFPRRKVCASGLSPRALKALRRLGLWERVAPEAYPIRGLRLVSPGGLGCVVAGGDNAAVLARPRLDEILMQAAVEAGAEFRPGVRATGLIYDHGRVAGVQTDKGAVTARWVINAGGANIRLGTPTRSRRILQTCMAWFEGVRFTPNVLEMVYDPAILPHYAWLFPESSERVNIGLCVDADRRCGSTRALFHDLLARHFGPRLRDAQTVEGPRGHPISVSGSVTTGHEQPGMLSAGEAAGLVNIATGEGISYALESGALAAAAIARGRYGGASAESVAAHFWAACRRRFRAGLRGGDLFARYGFRGLDLLARVGGSRLVRRATNEALVTMTG